MEPDGPEISVAKDGRPWIPEFAFTMVDNQHPHNESNPLTTDLEVMAPEATAENTELSSESTATQQHETAPATQPAAHTADTAIHDEPDYDSADFAAALASFESEQAAESAAAQSLSAEESIVTGTVIKITDKHVVVDIGLKSEGLIPLEQVLDINGT
ncbi:MAG TPA: S1 RNA-binding domain-containing protein, partial [Edaphobacter sp.]